MEFKQRTLMQIADLICGNFKIEENFYSDKKTQQQRTGPDAKR
jgi:hypothetical protein